MYSRDIDGLFLFVSFYDHPHPTFHLSALPQSEYSEAGGLNVKMDLDHCSRLKIDSDCGRGSGVSPANFWSIVDILLTFFCSSPSRYKQCHGSATNFRFLITVNHWTWQFICGNVTFGLLHSQQNAMQQCNMLQNVTCPPAPKHAFMFHAQIIFCFPCFGLTLQFYMTTVCWLYVHSLGFFNSYIDLNQYTQYEEKAHFSTAYFVFKESIMPV